MIKTKPEKLVLNVGGGGCNIPIPYIFNCRQILLDIDEEIKPDLLMDAKDLINYNDQKFDVIYCSHNLEHFYLHEVPIVLKGFYHVLKNDGFVHIRVPDLREVIGTMIAKNLNLYDELYKTELGYSIKVIDVIYGWSQAIEKNNNSFYAHKTGFTKEVLFQLLIDSSFKNINVTTGNLELHAIGYKKGE